MQNIDGKTRICGLIGNPVEHTLSPLIHNTLAEIMGHNLAYVPLLVKQSENETVSDTAGLHAAIRGAYALNILGLNVTVPFKSDVIPFLTETDPLAAAIGAVNTLVRTENGYKGYNTDMEGLYRAMCSEGIRISGEEILILGAGGAARAVAYLCASKGAAKIYLLNRSLSKAEEVAREINSSFKKECICPLVLAEYDRLPGRQFLAIQGTSVGMHPDDTAAVLTEESFYTKIHTGYDLIYRPAETRFMSLVKQAGGTAYNGLKMLLYQGIVAYELWNGVSVTPEAADQVYQLLKR